jgi:hypothetical protein
MSFTTWKPLIIWDFLIDIASNPSFQIEQTVNKIKSQVLISTIKQKSWSPNICLNFVLLFEIATFWLLSQNYRIDHSYRFLLKSEPEQQQRLGNPHSHSDSQKLAIPFIRKRFIYRIPSLSPIFVSISFCFLRSRLFDCRHTTIGSITRIGSFSNLNTHRNSDWATPHSHSDSQKLAIPFIRKRFIYRTPSLSPIFGSWWARSHWDSPTETAQSGKTNSRPKHEIVHNDEKAVSKGNHTEMIFFLDE